MNTKVNKFTQYVGELVEVTFNLTNGIEFKP